MGKRLFQEVYASQDRTDALALPELIVVSEEDDRDTVDFTYHTVHKSYFSKEKVVCPYCRKSNTTEAKIRSRKFKDILPSENGERKVIDLIFHQRYFRCDDCNRVFREDIDFAEDGCRYTNRLSDLLAEGTLTQTYEKVCKEYGVPASKTSVGVIMRRRLRMKTEQLPPLETPDALTIFVAYYYSAAYPVVLGLYGETVKLIDVLSESSESAYAVFFTGLDKGKVKQIFIDPDEQLHSAVINISIPGNATVNKLSLNVDEIRRMLEADVKFTKIKDITAFFGKSFATQAYSYDFAIYKAIKAKKGVVSKARGKQEELKKYIFIIDEINRGEISKIFGELFFAIDPGYRGRAGEISTQYANLHADPDEKFYIPENVYIIGTMNDIDRSVDSFDFAMRRRFRFVELKADERLEMLASLEDEELEAEAIRRMAALNREIASVEDLNENYQIGASYFLKLKTLNFDQLWTDYLQPLLHEYVQGMYDEDSLMSRFAKAYGYQKPSEGDAGEDTQG